MSISQILETAVAISVASLVDRFLIGHRPANSFVWLSMVLLISSCGRTATTLVGRSGTVDVPGDSLEPRWMCEKTTVASKRAPPSSLLSRGSSTGR
jgi:hypothetical protein